MLQEFARVFLKTSFHFFALLTANLQPYCGTAVVAWAIVIHACASSMTKATICNLLNPRFRVAAAPCSNKAFRATAKRLRCSPRCSASGLWVLFSPLAHGAGPLRSSRARREVGALQPLDASSVLTFLPPSFPSFLAQPRSRSRPRPRWARARSGKAADY